MRKHHFIWRLVVVDQVVRLKELRTFWDINDVMRANEILDIQQDVEWLAAEKMNAKMKHSQR